MRISDGCLYLGEDGEEIWGENGNKNNEARE